MQTDYLREQAAPRSCGCPSPGGIQDLGLDGQHGVGGDRGLELGETLKVHFNPNQSVILQFYETLSS